MEAEGEEQGSQEVALTFYCSSQARTGQNCRSTGTCRSTWPILGATLPTSRWKQDLSIWLSPSLLCCGSHCLTAWMMSSQPFAVPNPSYWA